MDQGNAKQDGTRRTRKQDTTHQQVNLQIDLSLFYDKIGFIDQNIYEWTYVRLASYLSHNVVATLNQRRINVAATSRAQWDEWSILNAESARSVMASGAKKSGKRQISFCTPGVASETGSLKCLEKRVNIKLLPITCGLWCLNAEHVPQAWCPAKSKSSNYLYLESKQLLLFALVRQYLEGS